MFSSSYKIVQRNTVGKVVREFVGTHDECHAVRNVWRCQLVNGSIVIEPIATR